MHAGVRVKHSSSKECAHNIDMLENGSFWRVFYEAMLTTSFKVSFLDDTFGEFKRYKNPLEFQVCKHSLHNTVWLSLEINVSLNYSLQLLILNPSISLRLPLHNWQGPMNTINKYISYMASRVWLDRTVLCFKAWGKFRDVRWAIGACTWHTSVMTICVGILLHQTFLFLYLVLEEKKTKPCPSKATVLYNY